MIDFEQPYILGVFWVVIIGALIVSMIWLRWVTARAEAKHDKTLEIQHREIATSASKIAVLEERAASRDAQRELEHKLAIQELANARNEWIDTRQRWTITASQLLIAKEWIRLLLIPLRDAGLAIPLPPNVEDIDRRPDESVYFPEIERSDEYRLDELIAEVRAHGRSWGTSPPLSVEQEPS